MKKWILMPTVLVVGAIPTISLVSCNPTQPPEPGPSLELSHEYHTLIDRYPYSCLYSDPVSITAAQHITFKIDPKLGKFQMPFTIFSFGHIENDIPVQVEPIDFEIEHLYVNDSEVDKSGETWTYISSGLVWFNPYYSAEIIQNQWLVTGQMVVNQPITDLFLLVTDRLE